MGKWHTSSDSPKSIVCCVAKPTWRAAAASPVCVCPVPQEPPDPSPGRHHPGVGLRRKTCGLHRGPGVSSPGSFCTVTRQLPPKRATTVPPTSGGPRLPGPTLPSPSSRHCHLQLLCQRPPCSQPSELLLEASPTATRWKVSGLRPQTASVLRGHLPHRDSNTNTQRLPDSLSRLPIPERQTRHPAASPTPPLGSLAYPHSTRERSGFSVPDPLLPNLPISVNA